MKRRTELIVMVGVPASGKSTFVEKNFGSHRCLSLDKLKSRARESRILQSLTESAVIDNTNVTKEARRRYIDFAKSRGMSIRAIYLNVDPEVAVERNSKREKAVPSHVIYFYQNKLVPPSVAEGFDSVEEIYCRRCGSEKAKLSDGGFYCISCGAEPHFPLRQSAKK